MSLEKKAYIADAFVSRITYRKTRLSDYYSHNLDKLHESWKEAYEWMVQDRQNKVQIAQKELERAIKSLEKVKQLKPKDEAP